MAFRVNCLADGGFLVSVGDRKLTFDSLEHSPNGQVGLMPVAVENEPLVWIGGGDVHLLSTARIMGFYARQNLRSVGLIIQYKGVTVCFLSNWEYFGGLTDIGCFGIDVLFLTLRGREGDMNGYDAVRLAKDLPARVTIPVNCDHELIALFEDGLVASNLYVEAPCFDKEIDIYSLLSRAELEH